MLFYLTILGFLITFLILWNLRTSNKANLYLFFFFLINNIYSLSHYAAMDSGNKYLIAIMLVHFTPFYLLIGPFFYFYVRGLVYDDHKLYKKDIIHFIPAIFILINISPYLFFSFDQKLFFATKVIRNAANILNNNFLFISPTISFISRPILIIPYVIFSASLIYKKGLNENYKNMQPKLIYRWLISLIGMALLLYLTFFMFSFIGYETRNIQLTKLRSEYILYATGLGLLLLNFSLLFFPNILYGLPQLDYKMIKQSKPIVEVNTSLKKEAKSFEISDDKKGEYCFYRYHLPDPIYFQSQCKVTIQQIGNSSVEKIRTLIKNGANIQPVFFIKQEGASDILNLKGTPPITYGLLDTSFEEGINNPFFDHKNFGMNFYRTDAVAATAYFYLDKPTNNLNTQVSKSDKFEKGSFGYDHAFLKKYHKDLVLLKNGEASLIVLPKYQGRVMTSSAEGDKGFSFGWINHNLIAANKLTPHFNAFGGEERFWLGPEGGQFSIYFKPNTEFKFENWYVPPSIDTEGFDLIATTNTEAVFNKKIHLLNYSGTPFDLEVNRKIKLLSTENITNTLGVKTGASIKAVGFETENKVKNIGQLPWTKNTGQLSIWVLSMLQANDHTTVFVPYQNGDETKLGKIVTDDYFGKLDTTRLKVKNGYLLFKADAKQRSKIGISPLRATPMAASYDAENKVLTIIQFTLPKGKTDYVNSLWQIQAEPFKGDALNAYTDGPVDGKQMGKFYELEGSSPAMALSPGDTQTHIQKTIHLKGNEMDLSALTLKLFGVQLSEIKL